MKNRFILALALATLVLTGCAKKNSLVGTWTSDDKNGPSEATFKSDGTCTLSGKLGNQQISMNFTYKEEPTQVTMTPTTVDAPGMDPKMLDLMNKQPKKAQSAKLEWKSPDEVLVTPADKSEGNPAMDLKRKA